MLSLNFTAEAVYLEQNGQRFAVELIARKVRNYLPNQFSDIM